MLNIKEMSFSLFTKSFKITNEKKIHFFQDARDTLVRFKERNWSQKIKERTFSLFSTDSNFISDNSLDYIENLEKPKSHELLNLGNMLTLIKYPLITEKSVSCYANQQFTFIVDRKLTKTELKNLLEKIFKVTIINVNTCMIPIKTRRVGKFTGRRSRYKKVYIKLKSGDTIADIFN
jgi:large subunit ribosomal protein L23